MLSARFYDALNYAGIIHASQTRKGTSIPYISHLLAVASIALEYGANQDEAIGALLHDAAEDQGGEPRLEDIGLPFGETVRGIVHDCSDTFETPKPDWETRKKKYIAEITTISSSARLVSAADKLHNTRAMLTDYRRHGHDLWPRFNASAKQQLWYLGALVEAFSEAGDHGELVGELERVVTELKSAVST